MTAYALINDGWGVYLPDSLRWLDSPFMLGHLLNIGICSFLLFSRSFLAYRSANAPSSWLYIHPGWVFVGVEIVVFTLYWQGNIADQSFWRASYQVGYAGFAIYCVLFLRHVAEAFRRKFSPV